MTRRIPILFIVVLLAVGAVGCGDDGAGGNNHGCPEGFEQGDSGCVPVFDDCPGRVEIPVLGGGCQPVGVTQCATGFVSDGEGGCDPILPSEPCPAGTMEILGETECRPVGVVSCADGFVFDGQGGCDPVLPQDPCPSGTIEALGQTDCEPLGDCGASTWGVIVTDATTIYVDRNYAGGDSDGSDASPFTTIGEALAAAQPGGQIAVAAGDYAERVVINQRLHLAGRCAELVTLRGITFLGQDRPPVTVTSGGSGTTIEGVTLTGDGVGLSVAGGRDVTVKDSQVFDTGHVGVLVDADAQAALWRVVVARSAATGISVLGSSMSVNGSVVRDVQPDSSGQFGRGIEATCIQFGGEVCGRLEVNRSVVSGNRQFGLFVLGMDTAVADSVVKDTSGQQSDRRWGRGIEAECYSANECGSLSVDGSVIDGNRDAGIGAYGVDVTIASTVVRNTQPLLVNGGVGRGIHVECHPSAERCGSVEIAESLVAANREAGIVLLGVDAAVASTIVRDTQSTEAGSVGGRGIASECHPTVGRCGTLSVEDCRVASNREIGISVMGPQAWVERTVVRDTECTELDGTFGRGINAQSYSPDSRGTLSVTSSVVAGNRDVGIFAAGVDVAVTSTLVENTRAQLSDGLGGSGVEVQCHPDQGVCGDLNVAGCVIRGNREAGIATFGASVALSETAVQQTLEHESGGQYGRGIMSDCDPDGARCGGIGAVNCLVDSNKNVGIYLAGVEAVLSGVAVLNTVPNDVGAWQKDFGQGVLGRCSEYTGECGSLRIVGSLVTSSVTAGLSVHGITGSVESSVIRSVLPRPLDQAFGYGILVDGSASGELVPFDVRWCVVRDSGLAGVVYVHASGTLTGCEVSGGQFAVVANVGSSPEVAADNLLSGTLQGGLFWSSMDPAPAPSPGIPSGVVNPVQ